MGHYGPGRAAGSERSLARSPHHRRQCSEIQVPDPVDQVEEQEGRGEEDTGVRVQLRHVYVDAPFPPGPRFALLVAAEEALTVLAVETLVDAGLFQLLPVQGVVEGDHRGGRGSHIQEGIVL